MFCLEDWGLGPIPPPLLSTPLAAAVAGDDEYIMMTLLLVQNNAIDILTKCDELRKQFMPMRWEVRGFYLSIRRVKASAVKCYRQQVAK